MCAHRGGGEHENLKYENLKHENLKQYSAHRSQEEKHMWVGEPARNVSGGSGTRRSNHCNQTRRNTVRAAFCMCDASVSLRSGVLLHFTHVGLGEEGWCVQWLEHWRQWSDEPVGWRRTAQAPTAMLLYSLGNWENVV